MSATLNRPLQGMKRLRLVLSAVRRIVLVGPLRPLLLRSYRLMSRTTPIETITFEDLAPFSIEDSVRGLRDNGVATGMAVSDKCVDMLLECYAAKPDGRYVNPHADHELIRQLASDERLIAVAREYLKAEPILLSSLLHTYVVGGSEADYFHFDVGDVLTMTFFVFLTDVDEEKGVTHQLIPGTHHKKTFRELWDSTLSDEKASVKFPGRLQTVAGKRGTAWFEDVLAFHKHGPIGQSRKVLSLQYSLHRKP